MARVTRNQAYPDVPGVALIICIESVPNESVREGASQDYIFFKETFEVMDFKTHPPMERLEWTREEFEQGVADAVQLFDEDASKEGPFFLCASTHGNENGIKLSDGKFLKNDDLRTILASHDRLRGKAKIILLQSCRGENCSTRNGMSSFSVDNASTEDTWGDTMCFQSCVATRAAFHSSNGSLFVIYFCAVVVTCILRGKGSCTINEVKRGVVNAMKNIMKINGQEIHPTPEVTADNLRAELILKAEDLKIVRERKDKIDRDMTKWGLKTVEEDRTETDSAGPPPDTLAKGNQPSQTEPDALTELPSSVATGSSLSAQTSSASLIETSSTVSSTTPASTVARVRTLAASSKDESKALCETPPPPASLFKPSLPPCDCGKYCKANRCDCRKNKSACSKKCHGGHHGTAQCSIPPCSSRCTNCTSCNCKKEGVYCTKDCDCHPKQTCQNRQRNSTMGFWYGLGIALFLLFFAPEHLSNFFS